MNERTFKSLYGQYPNPVKDSPLTRLKRPQDVIADFAALVNMEIGGVYEGITIKAENIRKLTYAYLQNLA